MKTFFANLVRILVTAAVMTWFAPLVLPGMSFSGSFAAGILLGACLWLVYTVMTRVNKKVFGVAEGACPMPSVMRIFVVIQFAVTVIFLAVTGMILTTPLVLTGVLSLMAAAVITLFGAVLSSVVVRLLRLDGMA